MHKFVTDKFSVLNYPKHFPFLNKSPLFTRIKLVDNIQCLLSTVHAGTDKAISLFVYLWKCLNVTAISAEAIMLPYCASKHTDMPTNIFATNKNICNYLNINTVNKTILYDHSDWEQFSRYKLNKTSFNRLINFL